MVDPLFLPVLLARLIDVSAVGKEVTCCDDARLPFGDPRAACGLGFRA